MEKEELLQKQMGRVENMLRCMLTKKQIAYIEGFTISQLETFIKNTYKVKNFTELANRYKEDTKFRLKQSMFDKAINDGNVTMQIWLSKQYLGYKEPRDKASEGWG